MSHAPPPSGPRQRADQLLVERGFFASRARAQAAIAAGLVTAGGVPVRKSAELIAADAEIVASEPHPWVSRGGVKLAAALDAFAIEPDGCTCLDLGASTGGFSEVLLERGARLVYAVDVGRGQLHPRIRGHARVVSLESTDARALDRSLIPEPIDLLVADVSFISLRLVLPSAVALLAERAAMAVLVKPQFEAGRAHVHKGLVRDEGVRRTVCREMEAFVAALGFTVAGVVPSPSRGATATGNTFWERGVAENQVVEGKAFWACGVAENHVAGARAFRACGVAESRGADRNDDLLGARRG